jgi:hypothetical protein
MSVVNFLEANGFIKMPLDNGKDSYHNIFSFGEQRILVSVTDEGGDKYTFHQSYKVIGHDRTTTYRSAYITEEVLMANLDKFLK